MINRSANQFFSDDGGPRTATASFRPVATLRKAQASAANRPEFKGNVSFVETRQFVRGEGDRARHSK
jgi:hypothetical protein